MGPLRGHAGVRKMALVFPGEGGGKEWMRKRREASRREAEVDSVSKWHITARIPVGYAELVSADAPEEGR